MPNSLHPNRLGRELRRRRKIAGVTKTELAAKAHLSVQTVRRLENGSGNLGSWRRAINALGLSVQGKTLPLGIPLGMAFAELRRRKGVTQRELSSMVRISQRALIAFERRNEGRLATLECVGAALGAGLYLRDDASQTSTSLTATGTQISHQH